MRGFTKKANYYIRVFLRNIDIDHLNSCIARSGANTLSLFREFQGQPPQRTRGAVDTVAAKAARLIDQNPDFRRACELIRAIPETYAMAALAWEYYRNRTVEVPSGRKPKRVRLRSGEDVAMYVDIPFQSLRYRRSKALQMINAELGIFVA